MAQPTGIFFQVPYFLSLTIPIYYNKKYFSSSGYLNNLFNIQSLETTSTHLNALSKHSDKIKTEVDLFSLQ